MSKYSIDFWNWVLWNIESEYFSHPFWKRDITQELLNNYSKKINSSLIAIDWTSFSTNIEFFDWTKIDIWNVDFLQPWIDWVILTWLNDIDKTRFEWKSAIWIILGVWDCAPIIWSSWDWELIFNLHVWYKWLFWSWNEDNPWIIFNFFDSLQKRWIYPSSLWKIHFWPMAWNDFELPLNYFESLIKFISKEYSLIDFKEYFKLNWKINSNWEKLWYLDIRWVIDILFRYHWVPMYNIYDSWINTTDRNNDWPSYRLFTNWQQKNNNRLTATIWKLLY